MSKISTVAELFIINKSIMKCLKCSKDFEFSINENVYIRLDKGCFVFDCPNCGAKHKVDLDIDLLDEEDKQ